MYLCMVTILFSFSKYFDLLFLNFHMHITYFNSHHPFTIYLPPAAPRASPNTSPSQLRVLLFFFFKITISQTPINIGLDAWVWPSAQVWATYQKPHLQRKMAVTQKLSTASSTSAKGEAP